MRVRNAYDLPAGLFVKAKGEDDCARGLEALFEEQLEGGPAGEIRLSDETSTLLSTSRLTEYQ